MLVVINKKRGLGNSLCATHKGWKNILDIQRVKNGILGASPCGLGFTLQSSGEGFPLQSLTRIRKVGLMMIPAFCHGKIIRVLRPANNLRFVITSLACGSRKKSPPMRVVFFIGWSFSGLVLLLLCCLSKGRKWVLPELFNEKKHFYEQQHEAKIIKADAYVMGNPEHKAQHKVKGLDRRLGDCWQRRYYRPLSCAATEPSQASAGEGD